MPHAMLSAARTNSEDCQSGTDCQDRASFESTHQCAACPVALEQRRRRAPFADEALMLWLAGHRAVASLKDPPPFVTPTIPLRNSTKTRAALCCWPPAPPPPATPDFCYQAVGR
eukprot:COSAG02_NODE_131_length_34710_cov_17.171159_27_plen_114_part_00